jgi:gas vesicle structural protein
MAAVAHSPRGYIERPRPSGLADVLEIILDKGIVIDAYVRVSLVGIELLTIDARIVIASVDTYLRFAEAVNRLDLTEADDSEGLPELMESMTSGGAKSKTQGALEGVKEKLFGDDDDDDGGNGKQRQRRTSRASSSRASSGRGSSSKASSSRSRAKSGSGNSK